MSLEQKNFLSLLKKIGINETIRLLLNKNLEIRSLTLNPLTKNVIIVLKQLTITDIEIIEMVKTKAQESIFQITFQWLKQFNWYKELSTIEKYIAYFHNKEYKNENLNFSLSLDQEKKSLKINFQNENLNFQMYEKKIIQWFEQYGIHIEEIAINQNKNLPNQEKEKILKLYNSINNNKDKLVKKYLEDQFEIKGKILTINEKIINEGQLFEILLEGSKKSWMVKWLKKDDKYNSDILKKYTTILFKGKKDDYKPDLFYATSFEKIQPIFKRLDNAKKKRVELHVHTKMSTLDGIGDLEEYVAQASAWKHKAIAFTDHENIHIFPECDKIKIKYPDIKIIFGCEFEFLSEQGWVMSQKINEKIENQKLVFFDIETTGLSSNFHNMIEFAAIVVENHLITHNETFLIKTEKIIPKNIQELTKISQEEYDKEAIPFEIAMDKIKKIFKNAILIAQNINFDIAFIKKGFKKQGWDEIQNPMIDILNLSRYLNRNLRQHNLKKIAKYHKVHYSKVGAHRAKYDTEVLKKIFDAFIARHDLRYLEDFWKMNDDLSIRKRMFARHINVLVKNQEGLQDLYYLVSQTHTKSLYRKPVLEKKEIEKFRKNLLLGAGCYNSEIFNKACFGNQQELEKAMLFYDYIEIQPLEIYQHLIDKEIISMANLKTIINNIIQTAKKLDKTLVASGDVHYLEPEHRIYRDIFIFNKQLGGFYHDLYDSKGRVKRTSLQYFRTTDEMLKAFDFLDAKLAEEIVIDNTHKIADQIEQITCFKKEFLMPRIFDDANRLKIIAVEKLANKYGQNLDIKLKNRFDHELEQIIKSGYSTIYLISYYLTDYSLKKGYFFSSRGSVGSSFLAYCLEITEVNPLKPHYVCSNCFYFEWADDKKILSGFDLLNKKCPECKEWLKKDGHEIAFESFLGLNSETIPDIDLNFSGLFQQEAQKFVFHLLEKELGKNKIFWTGTVNTIAAKSAYGYYKNYLEKKEIKDELSFSETQRTVFYCSGVKKTTGQHPGGLIIVPKERDILDYTPYNFPSNNPESGNYTTHFDYHVLKNQLLKIDILGHDDPTGLKILEEMTGINPKKIDLGEPKIIKLFSDINVLNLTNDKLIKKSGVLGLPEFGTKFVSKMLIDIKVKSFSHLISVSGLSHGKNVWENNAKNLIQNEKFSIDEVISSRDDILFFLIKNGFEKKHAYQIMNKVKKGKPLDNKEEKMMREKKIPNWYIESCRKIRYLFPKAHATAYVIMACRFAWFKIYYPHEFYATYFSIRCDVFDLDTILNGIDVIQKKWEELNKKIKMWQYQKGEKISTKEKNLIPIYEISIEMLQRKVKMSPLDLNLSETDLFTVQNINNTKYIIPPFIAIDGLGIEVAKKIVEERKIKKFTSQENFKIRTKVNQTVFKKLLDMKLFDKLPKKEQNTFDFY